MTERELIKAPSSRLGRLGGKMRTPAKARAARLNGRKRGKPGKVK